MTKTNRKPCWWCGNDEIGVRRVPVWDKHQAYCTMCAAAGPFAKSKSAAVRKWNQGPQQVSKS